MRTALYIVNAALFLVCFTSCAHTKSAEILFTRADYRFSVVSCEAKATKSEKKKITLVISYVVPKDARFLLYVSRSLGDSALNSLYWEELNTTPTGEVKAEFECDREPPAFYVGLWRGVGGGSPSGILCDGAIVSLPLKITSVFRREDRSPNQSLDTNALSRQ